MLPRVALVDPELALGLPAAATAATGMDALTQLIEPYLSCRAHPMTDALCRDGIGRVARALPRACAEPGAHAGRRAVARGARYSGLARANAGLGAVHGFAGPICGAFAAPHGAVCAALLAPVLRVNLAALRARAPGHPALARLAEVACWLTGDPAATADDAAPFCAELSRKLAIPGLGAWGVCRADVTGLVGKAAAASSMKGNPLPLTTAELPPRSKRGCRRGGLNARAGQRSPEKPARRGGCSVTASVRPMRTALALCFALCCCLLRATSEEETSRWMKSFYRTDDTAPFDAFWKKTVDEKLLENENAIAPTVSLREPGAAAAPRVAEGAAGRLVERPWRATAAPSRHPLAERHAGGARDPAHERARRIHRAQAAAIGATRIEKAEDLDFCWGWYFATGDTAALDPIVSVLDFGEYSGAAKRYATSEKTEADRTAAYTDAMFGAAMWSLEANGREDARIVEHLETVSPIRRRRCCAASGWRRP
jgi:hypothetical protein